MPATYEPIASQTISSSTNSVTFSNIPGTFSDLSLVMSIQSTAAATITGGSLRLNSDSGSNYSHTLLFGNGSATGSARGSSTSYMRYGNDVPTSRYTNIILHFMSYANTNVNKTVLSSAADAGSDATRLVGLWRSTAAITSITLYSNDSGSANFSAGTFSLYGIKAA